jgi:hypothetical protein
MFITDHEFVQPKNYRREYQQHGISKPRCESNGNIVQQPNHMHRVSASSVWFFFGSVPLLPIQNPLPNR